jgi:hypothetical protein
MEHVLEPKRYDELLQNPDTWRKQGYESAASAALDQGVLTLKLLDWGHSEIHESSSRKVLLSVEQDGSTQHDQYISSSSGETGSSLALQRLPPAKGFIEMIYTFWYKDKSDSWRLFHSLVPRLDGRAWPERKRREVTEFYELVSELQDVKLEAKFFDDTAVDSRGKVRYLDCSDLVCSAIEAACTVTVLVLLLPLLLFPLATPVRSSCLQLGGYPVSAAAVAVAVVAAAARCGA